MLTIKLRGGLGNQLFQYAFGRNASIKIGTTLALNPHGYNDPRYAKLNTARKYLLDNFNIEAEVINVETHKRFNSLPSRIWRRARQFINKDNPWIFNPKELSCKDGDYKIGYWQSEKYFKESETTIRKELTLKKPLSQKALEIKDEINNCPESLSIHIRRTDYINDPLFSGSSCNKDYYEKALNIIIHKLGERIKLFVFSDDIDWVRKNMNIPNPVYISGLGLDECEELSLMSQCKHNIIANSTFSWWGAWLNHNPEKIVIAPKHWTSPNIPSPDIIPDTWTKM